MRILILDIFFAFFIFKILSNFLKIEPLKSKILIFPLMKFIGKYDNCP